MNQQTILMNRNSCLFSAIFYEESWLMWRWQATPPILLCRQGEGSDHELSFSDFRRRLMLVSLGFW